MVGEYNKPGGQRVLQSADVITDVRKLYRGRRVAIYPTISPRVRMVEVDGYEAGHIVLSKRGVA